jgi:hypothetical protein
MKQFGGVMSKPWGKNQRLSVLDDAMGPDYHSVVETLRNEMQKIEADLPKVKDGERQLFAIDFSEIFGYIFDIRTHREDSMLVRYILNNKKIRDFDFVLLYPTIIEMRKFYHELNERTQLYKDHDTLKDLNEIKEIQKLIKLVNNPSDIPKEKVFTIWNSLEAVYQSIINSDTLS